ncbi:hypothetical protein BBK36DRAFT_1171752 [Trichoderma citrinoviride]|uniref:Malate dehydrogenase n=1 Tax=Trichoderma citrinoviride TaxID=58853 RepID=A0A2T4B2W2_9HYPO|nr:hypothetical protein BBK36DRAFT_1171752 [Trichoderma citrinoviride]PTB63541.1 hypothetical protein BBK36DRAFT_1171752 [Trichoderma citrinoviride]
MRPSTILVSSLAVFGARAAPAQPKIDLDNIKNPASAVNSLTEYFNLVAAKTEIAKVQPTAQLCDISKSQMPSVDGLLPPPSANLTVKHVAIGRGTQNYTCDTSKPDAPPVATGALATLFNASYIACVSQDLLQKVPNMAVNFNFDAAAAGPGPLGPMTLDVSGHHYFLDTTTPFFNLDTPALDIGTVPCAKNSSIAAPSSSASGPDGQAAVPWLKLTAKNGTTGSIREVYRINTAGGSAPATCQGQPANIQVQYSAVYWFWGSN